MLFIASRTWRLLTELVVKIGLKVTFLAILPILLTAVIAFGVSLYQKNVIETFFNHEIDAQARNEARKIAQAVYLMCRAAQESVQKTIDADLRVAEDLLARSGEIRFSDEQVHWEAVNQYTGEVTDIFLPAMLVGERWLDQNRDIDEHAPIVDEIRALVGGTATVFQRMNEAGDMLRVVTNVQQSDGSRAIGTFIPARNPDGEPNPVIAALLRGETFHGRAYVVNDWYVTAYRPILDATGKQVIGALNVGVKQENLESLRQGIMDMVVGKTGYVYVLGGKGEERGRYVISHHGQRDGENIWDSRDTDDRLFIQAIVKQALALPMPQRDGEIPVAFERYPWKNPGESEPRYKSVAIAYFAPWDWVIGAGYYENDLHQSQQHMVAALRHMGVWLGGTALAMVLLSIPVGYLVARGISLRVNSILKSVTDVLIVVDVHDRIILLSQAAENLLRIPLPKARFHPLREAVADALLRQKISAALEQKQTGVRFDVELPSGDAEDARILEGRTSLIQGPSENPVGMIIIMHDVTSERRIERMKSEFISTAAHELSTPLASIIGYSELLLSRAADLEELEKNSLTYINRKAWALSKIVDELLDVSRVESGHTLPLEKQLCDLNELIRRSVTKARALGNRHRFKLSLFKEPMLLTVDRVKIEQVFDNILSNAVKFSPNGGEIGVRYRIVDHACEICIEDQGIGMTAEEVARIFDTFYRADASNTAVEGTGLGMSIVRHTVNAHGGKVRVESQPGAGTRVYVRLPLDPEEPPSE